MIGEIYMYLTLNVNSQGELPPASLVIHRQTPYRAHAGKCYLVQTGPGISLIYQSYHLFIYTVLIERAIHNTMCSNALIPNIL